jgi:serine/threonine protein kinase
MADVDPDRKLGADGDSGPEAERDRIDLLAEEFAACCRRGEQPSVSEFAARHPDYAEQIRATLPAVALMEQLKRHRRGPEIGDPDGDPDFEVSVDNLTGAPLKRLGDLRIVREIGRGGMGIVYEAVQETLDRRVALKLLPRHSFLDLRTVQRFRREAQAVAQLHHPHIVPVFGVGEQEGLHYYVMQLIAGRGLHEVIRALRRGEPLAKVLERPGSSRAAALESELKSPATAGEAAEIVRRLDDGYWRFVARAALDVAEALEYAHGEGVLHRDIKPANLLRDERGKVWVTDFGLAKLAQQGDLTATGDIIGTLKYMAPEGLQGESDARSDIYGLGMTMYELLTLEPPFDDSNPSRLIRRVGEDQPIRPRKHNPSIPRDLETIVLKATAREPGDRYPTARALADDIGRFLDDRPVQARRATLAEKFGRWCRRNKPLAALAAIALSSLLFAAVVGWVGYATTRRALEGELRRRREADAATQRAESNVALSLEALEEIFNNLTLRPLTPTFGFPDRNRPPGEPPPPGFPPRRGVDDGQTALLQSILGFYDRFAALNETNATLKREAAKAHRRIGELRQRLGQFDAAAAAFGRSAALFEALAAEFPDSPDDRHALAETLIVQEPGSDTPDALRSALERWQRARAIEAKLTGELPAEMEYVAALAGIESKLGAVLDRLGRTADAEVSLQRAVSLRNRVAERFPEGSYNTFLLAVARTAQAGFLVKHRQPAAALICLDTCVPEVKAMASRPFSMEMSRLLSIEFDDLAALYQKLGDSTRAEELTTLARGVHEPRPGGRRPGPPPSRGHGPGFREHDRPPPSPPGEGPWEGGPGGPFPHGPER